MVLKLNYKMSSSIIITLCLLLLLAYIFDVTSSRTKIPSVILLLVLGVCVRLAADFFKVVIPDLTPILPVIGTIGLILIVLEGSLELEIKKENLGLICKSAIVAFVPILVLSFLIAEGIFYYDTEISFKDSLTNAIPLAIISSAVAISTAKALDKSKYEFVVYESSLSDVFGVIFFNFVTLREFINTESIGYFFLDILLILIVSAFASLALAYLINKIKHKVKFAPIILLVIIIYVVSKMYHLPALLFILLFGLFIGNLDELIHFDFIQKVQPKVLQKEIQKFKEITTEFTFLIRTLFFILFGYLIKLDELFNINTLPWAFAIVSAILVVRILVLKLVRVPMQSLVFIAPRGLITILLFLSIPVTKHSPLMNNSLVIQVIILSALLMMVGLMFTKKTD